MNNASVEKILEVNIHPNADKLELAKVLGYQCVIPKDTYKVGDSILFVKPDSILPDSEWAKPYLKYAVKRVKAIKIRGEWSEGLVIPLTSIPIIEGIFEDSVDRVLNISHYEPPKPYHLDAKSSALPFNIPKTDETRFENLYRELPDFIGEIVDVTLKVDGQSCSYYYNIDTDTFGVLSRSMELKEEAYNKYTHHIGKSFDRERFINYCKRNNVSLCIRGESYGAGIQSIKCNPHTSKAANIAFFSVYNITEKRYENKGDKHYYRNVCKELDLPEVPIIEEDTILTYDLLRIYSEDISYLDGEYFEGVVIKGKHFSFKVINKVYDSLK